MLFTHRNTVGISDPENTTLWEVGRFKRDNICIIGLFDHAVSYDGYKERQETFNPDAKKLYISCLKRFVPQGSSVFGYFIPRTNWTYGVQIVRPKEYSWWKWLCTSQYEKDCVYWRKHAKEDNVKIMKDFEDTAHVTVTFGNDISVVEKYFQRFAIFPDDEVDVLYVAGNNSESVVYDDLKIPFIHDRLIAHQFATFNKDQWSIFTELLSKFPTLLWAWDGHFYIASGELTLQEMMEKVQSVAREYGEVPTQDRLL